ncbi:hypothetical protein AKJ09_08214 [Labilithrix luteola]|uniref:Uncharacterized protein n=1 Tax=Labilithrix luteola TaxID=1391654 RepID=A0A0K1Q6U2_9BACT|nr:hypothetical protein AKJ09_08214 [Labilithrix luteola]
MVVSRSTALRFTSFGRPRVQPLGPPARFRLLLCARARSRSHRILQHEVERLRSSYGSRCFSRRCREQRVTHSRHAQGDELVCRRVL